jgi:hypothetical protein
MAGEAVLTGPSTGLRATVQVCITDDMSFKSLWDERKTSQQQQSLTAFRK